MKSDVTQLEREISAVKTALDVSKLLISSSNQGDDEKGKLTAVLDMVYSNYIARLVGKEALEISVRKLNNAQIRKEIAEMTEREIGGLTVLLSQKGVI